MKRLLGALAAAALCGCSTTLTRLPAPKGLHEPTVQPLATVEVSNASLLFLSFLPIASGDPSAPNSGGSLWFTDTTTVESQLKMLEDEAARIGATRAVDVTTLRTDESLFFFLLQREKIHTSAVLVRDVPTAGGTGAVPSERTTRNPLK